MEPFTYSEVTPTQLGSLYESGQRVFRRIELGADNVPAEVARLDLSGAEFVECWFHSATFEQVDFRGSSFKTCNLKCTMFRQCDLDETIWDDCSICSMQSEASVLRDISVGELYWYGATVNSVQEFLRCIGKGDDLGSEAGSSI